MADALRNHLDGANPQTLADILRSLGFGMVTRTLRTFLRGKAPAAAGANPYVAAAAQSYTLPADAKGQSIVYGYARAGAGTVGLLTADATDVGAPVAPAAGHCKLSSSGDVMFNAADAWTSVDIEYQPEKQDQLQITLPVATNAATVPAAAGLVVSLMQCAATAGTSVGTKIIDSPGTASAAGHASLNAAKTQVAFNSADAVTQCSLLLGVASAIDVDALLEGTSVEV